MRSFALCLLLVGCHGANGSSAPPSPEGPAPVTTPSPSSTPVHSAPPAAPVASAPAPSGDALSVTGLRALKPKALSTHRLRGYVVMRYTCPPCPPKALCKPCMGDNIVLSDDPKLHERYDLSDREVIVFTPTPVTFELGKQVTVKVRVLERQNSNKGIPDLELVADAIEECPYAVPDKGAACNRPRPRPCTYPSGKKDCRTNVATCADGHWVIDCID